eukprot:TRINITY_DN12004_c0_g1_i1.p2 TRINITY_DN12004_c0_g1~~TRINITY_DN12004_c0_g1_i1.p2  ORF type:complete len:191 (-),score=35.97 TRINITY_DN12004_c0_g1_i1:931-1503(-)
MERVVEEDGDLVGERERLSVADLLGTPVFVAVLFGDCVSEWVSVADNVAPLLALLLWDGVILRDSVFDFEFVGERESEAVPVFVSSTEFVVDPLADSVVESDSVSLPEADAVALVEGEREREILPVDDPEGEPVADCEGDLLSDLDGIQESEKDPLGLCESESLAELDKLAVSDPEKLSVPEGLSDKLAE